MITSAERCHMRDRQTVQIGRSGALLRPAQPVAGTWHRELVAVYVVDPRHCGVSDEQDADARASSPSTHPNIRFCTASECPIAGGLSTCLSAVRVLKVSLALSWQDVPRSSLQRDRSTTC